MSNCSVGKRARNSVGCFLIGLLIAAQVQAASVTNTYNGVTITTNSFTVTLTGGSTELDIFTNGAALNVIGSVFLNSAGSAGPNTAILHFDGSTNIIGNGLTTQGVAGQTGIVNYVNGSLVIVTNGLNIATSGAGVAFLGVTNSTILNRGATGLLVGYGGLSKGFLNIKNSFVDLGGASLQLAIGSAGGMGVGAINDAIVTNFQNLVIGSAGNGILTVSNSTIVMDTAGVQAFSVGGPSNGPSVFTLDSSTYRNSGNTLGYIGQLAGQTGVVNVVNGSLFDFIAQTFSGRPFKVGDLGVGTLNISNATVKVSFSGLSAALEIGTGVNGAGTVNVVSGTNMVDWNITLGETNGAVGTYNVSGNSLVKVGAVVGGFTGIAVGSSVGSTGTFTVAGTSSIIVTNAANNAAINVGPAGKGSFTMNGGSVTTDKLLATNGTLSTFALNAGTLNVKSSTAVSNGSAFVVGDGIQAATLDLVSGGHSFANGLSVSSNGTLKGFATISNAVSIFDGGTLAPGNSPGTLTITTNLTLSSGSLLSYELGPHNTSGIGYIGLGSNDLTVVNGTLTLDGILNVIPLSGFGAIGSGAASTNVYRLFNYTAAFIDNGLVLGDLPTGLRGWIDTSISGQVNLLIIPEPGISVIFLVSGVTLWWARRRQS